MNEWEYNLGNIFVVLLTSAGVYFLPPIPSVLLFLVTLLFQFMTSQQYSQENTAKVDWHFLIVSCLLGLSFFWTPPAMRPSVMVAGILVFVLFLLSNFHKGEKDETAQAIEEIRGKMGRQMAVAVSELEARLENTISADEATRRESLLREQLADAQRREIAELEERHLQKIAALQSEKNNRNESEIQRITRNKDIEINKIKEQTNRLINQFLAEYKGKIEQKNQELEKLKETNSTLLQENSNQKRLITEHENTISAQQELLKNLNTNISEMNQKLDKAVSEKEKAEEETRALEHNMKLIHDGFPDRYQKKKVGLQKKYKHIKNAKVLDFIATGEIHYEISKEIREGDYSAIVIEYAKSVETLFIDVLKAKHLYRPRDETRTLFNLMEDYIDSAKFAHLWDNEFKERLNNVRTIRNPAAHKATLSYEEAMKLRTIVMGGGETGIEKDGLIAYMDSILHDS